MADWIDLRSDTVTRPSPEMRAAMAQAEVGDDVYGEDPTAKELERRVASLLGKEAALFVPSGTMANQLALLAQAERGDEVLIGEGAHVAFYESGAGAAISGVQFVEVGAGGTFNAEELEPKIKPSAYYHPRPRIVAVENTHNRGGGRVFPQEDILGIEEVARRHGLAMHLDGARLWNAAVATGSSEAELAAPFDSVSVCFSKGLGAPVGSALAADRDVITKAHRWRKMLGGGMRQSGVLAAAALFALEHHRSRIARDHEAAAALATGLDPDLLTAAQPATNIVNITCRTMPAEALAVAAKARGVLLNPVAADRLRAVTHLDLTLPEVERAASILSEEAARAASGGVAAR